MLCSSLLTICEFEKTINKVLEDTLKCSRPFVIQSLSLICDIESPGLATASTIKNFSKPSFTSVLSFKLHFMVLEQFVAVICSMAFGFSEFFIL